MKVLFFCPFILVDEFSLPFLIIYKILQGLKINSSFVFCDRSMEKSCIGMMAYSKKIQLTKDEKKNLCIECTKKSKYINKIIRDPIYWLKQNETLLSILSRQEKKLIRRDCLYELLLRFKTSNIPKNKLFRNLYDQKYKTNKNVYRQFKNILEIEKPNVLFLLNSMYSINHSLSELAQRNGIKFVSFQRGLAANNQNHVFTTGHHVHWLWKMAKYIKSFDITNKTKKECKNHISYLTKAKRAWDYSLPMSPLKTKNIYQKKVILVLLSSSDEIFAAIQCGFFRKQVNHLHVFKSQEEFILEILKMSKYFPEETFFIRAHPRMFANKRDSRLSSEGKFLENNIRPVLLNESKSFHNIVWPKSDNLGSLWDNFNTTKLVLNAWSSAAEAFAFNKIPVVSAFPFFENSQNNLHYFAKSKHQYRELVRKILNNPQKYNRPKLAAKWIFASTQLNSVQILPFPSKIEKVVGKVFPVLSFKVKAFFLLKIKSLTNCKTNKFFQDLLVSRLPICDRLFP